MFDEHIDEPDKLNLIEQALEVVAERQGDVFPLILERYYREYPEAVAMFEEHGGSEKASLEISMLEQTLYCVMRWYERQSIVKSVLINAVPNHDFWGIPIDTFKGLFLVAFDVMREGLAPGHEQLVVAIDDLERDLLKAIY